jgi:hypothetical protein
LSGCYIAVGAGKRRNMVEGRGIEPLAMREPESSNGTNRPPISNCGSRGEPLTGGGRASSAYKNPVIGQSIRKVLELVLGAVGLEPTCLDGGGFKDRCGYLFHHAPISAAIGHPPVAAFVCTGSILRSLCRARAQDIAFFSFDIAACRECRAPWISCSTPWR